ncbi:MAG: hypothetical protein IT375_01135 [Polyangiaceae bacterium]|nr:hypothetical protein [Polyangiaceae bacterium]
MRKPSALRCRTCPGCGSPCCSDRQRARLWQELPDGLAVLDRFVVAIARLVEQT